MVFVKGFVIMAPLFFLWGISLGGVRVNESESQKANRIDNELSKNRKAFREAKTLDQKFLVHGRLVKLIQREGIDEFGWLNDQRKHLLKMIIEVDPTIGFAALMKKIGLKENWRVTIYETDVDGDGVKELFLMFNGNDNVDFDNGIILLRKDSQNRIHFKSFRAFWGTRVLQDADLNHDGIREVILVTNGGNGAGGSCAYVFGKVAGGVDAILTTPRLSYDGLALKDLDGDGIDELIGNEVVDYNRIYFPIIYKFSKTSYVDDSCHFLKMLIEKYQSDFTRKGWIQKVGQEPSPEDVRREIEKRNYLASHFKKKSAQHKNTWELYIQALDDYGR